MNLRPLLALLLLLPAAAAAAPPAARDAADPVVPEQAVVGAEKPVPLGELVTLALSPVKARPDGLESTSVTWKVYDGPQEKKFAVDAEGRVFFGAGLKPRQLLAVAAVTHLYVIKEGPQVKEVLTKTVLLSVIVTIGDDRPPQGPDRPPPPPGAEPAFADGRFALARAAWSWAQKAVPPPERRRGAALAASFRAVAAAARAGGLKTPADILAATKAGNDRALGAGLAAWGPWFTLAQEGLFALSQAGTLASPGDYAAAWEELASGLEKVQ